MLDSPSYVVFHHIFTSRILEEDFGFSDTRVGEEGPGLFDDDELALGFQATTVEPLEQMEEPLNGTNILAVTAEDRPVPLAPKRSHEERQRHDETELEGNFHIINVFKRLVPKYRGNNP